MLRGDGQKDRGCGADPHPRRAPAPVTVWIGRPEDVMAAQRIAGIVGRSLGLDSVDVFMAVAETAEKGGALLEGSPGCGRITLTPGGSATRPRLSVDIQTDLAGAIGVSPAYAF